ncbi:MAG: hypothetical protein HYY44_01100 [Deltaproteobacteria bacterium]|nr:hypothetical protein [Deltaproteobacteria bacterium]MBI4374068.1 hypothetical protein [Deltaproteobacteria bacterium]
MTQNFQHWRLTIGGPKKKRKIEARQRIDQKSQINMRGFVEPLTGKCGKIYVVLGNRSKKILYVGISFQPISSRLRGGLQASGKGGYSGYKWKNKNAVELLVWSFPQDPPSKAKLVTRDKLEAIEGEVVFLIRKCLKHWPFCQNEIHFHEANDRGEKTAKRILDDVKRCKGK